MIAKLSWVCTICSGLLWAGVAFAQNGFYGGYADRQQQLHGGPAPGTAWSKLAPVAKEEAAGGTLLYGGYRFREAFAVEAALSSLQTSSSLGLRLDPRSLLPGAAKALGGEQRPQSWSLDVFTQWAIQPALSLYGRLGYGSGDGRLLSGASASAEAGTRRSGREGFNYGIGLHYDLGRTLGLRLEYARYGFTLPGGELSKGLPESDQLAIGVQYRF